MRDFVFVITGASEGIGAELAHLASRAGAKVVVAARRIEKLQEVVARCEAAGGQALAVQADVGEESACQALIARAVERFGRLDVLVNNAGISMSAPFSEVKDLGMFERLMRVNYLSAVYCTYHALPHLERQKGIVVGVSSLQGKTGFPFSSGYCASKYAMQGFFDALRIELRPKGVAVLVASPGPVDTQIHNRKLGPDGALAHHGKDFSGKKQMTPVRCAELILGAIRARRRELVMTMPGKLAVWLRPFLPAFVDSQVERGVKEFYDLG
jgi:NAD(P)-dependent dehydrogenase (short-subunit alcohol dehydrogenase family)